MTAYSKLTTTKQVSTMRKFSTLNGNIARHWTMNHNQHKFGHNRNFSSKPGYQLRFHHVVVPVLVIGAGLVVISSSVIDENMMENQPETPDRPHDAEKEEGDPECPHIHCLRVRVKRGNVLSADYDMFCTADAYVEIEYDGKKKRTKAVKNTTSPIWNQLLRFKNAKIGKEIKVKVYDYDHVTTNDFIGYAVLKNALPTNYNETKEIEVNLKDPKREGKNTATVSIVLEFTKLNRV